MAENRISEVAVEVLNSGIANIRMSEVNLEVLYAGNSTVRASEVAVEVLRSVADQVVSSSKPPILIIVT